MHSQRLDRLPPYLFVEIDRLKAAYAKSGRTVLDLGIGDPDLGAPPELIDAFHRAMDDRSHDRYPPDLGLPRLVDSIISWAETRYATTLSADEVLVTIGSKEAIAHLPLAVTDPGDVVLVPDPGYPVYNASAVFAGAEPVTFPLRAESGYWPDFSAIERGTARRANLLFLNYPNNPTAALTVEGQYEEALSFCRENRIVLASDAAYSEITYEKPFEPIFPRARGAGVPFIELFSFSKTFSITGWRIGFAVGSPAVIASLAKLKSNLDSGVYGAIQEAVACLLDDRFEEITDRIRARYRVRRDILARGLARSGFTFAVPAATFYFWIRTPDGSGSIDFCKRLLEETGIVATPGNGFGTEGEGHFRLSITTSPEIITEAAERLGAYAAGRS
jgi:LL-diaminopimelate aminotransferase